MSNRALDVLKNTTDAKGRKIEVCKIRLPPPQFRNYREAEGLAVSRLSFSVSFAFQFSVDTTCLTTVGGGCGRVSFPWR